MNGYTGKILRVNLTTREISTIDTEKYKEYGGGHGIGSAIFWDLCPEKAISAFDPRNVVTMMTSPLSGTLVPSGSGRTEIQAIGPQSYPVEWFTRSNFGGRWSAMLKYAGWDGIVIEGKADKPVWIDIRNDAVQIRDAGHLWGLDSWAAQEEIWADVMHGKLSGDWAQMETARDAGRTTQKPAVACIGQAGEHLVRTATVQHDAGNAGGQGGMGAVFGSKNLKAVSVVGTGSVKVANPSALMEARLWLVKNHQYDVDNPLRPAPIDNFPMWGTFTRSAGRGPLVIGQVEPSRPQGCMGCAINCRLRTQSGHSNESMCVESLFYMVPNKQHETYQITDLSQKYGLGVYELLKHDWLRALYKMGILGKGKQIHTDLPFEKYGTYEFEAALLHAIAYREDIGADLAEGLSRCAKKWGRLEQDTRSGLLNLPNWGYMEHYDPRVEVEWSYGSILGDRDINEHDFNWYVHWYPLTHKALGLETAATAQQVVEKMASHMPGHGDPMGFDYSEEGIYSDAKAKTIAWHRHYTRFFKQSALFCDWAWPHLFDVNNPDYDGSTPEGEPMFWNAVTGQNLTFEQGMEIGRKIWNLDRAIWILQGRHRDMEVHAGYVYEVPIAAPYWLPEFRDGQWVWGDQVGRKMDRQKFEDWKTRYFKLEGWDPATGWPTRATLESLGLERVAEELEKQGKLGA